jgi:hypothetical protein
MIEYLISMPLSFCQTPCLPYTRGERRRYSYNQVLPAITQCGLPLIPDYSITQVQNATQIKHGPILARSRFPIKFSASHSRSNTLPITK